MSMVPVSQQSGALLSPSLDNAVNSQSLVGKIRGYDTRIQELERQLDDAREECNQLRGTVQDLLAQQAKARNNNERLIQDLSRRVDELARQVARRPNY